MAWISKTTCDAGLLLLCMLVLLQLSSAQLPGPPVPQPVTSTTTAGFVLRMPGCPSQINAKSSVSVEPVALASNQLSARATVYVNLTGAGQPLENVQLVYSIMNQQQQQQGPPNPLPQSPGAQQNQAGVQVVMLVQDPQALGNFRASGIILGQGQILLYQAFFLYQGLQCASDTFQYTLSLMPSSQPISAETAPAVGNNGPVSGPPLSIPPLGTARQNCPVVRFTPSVVEMTSGNQALTGGVRNYRVVFLPFDNVPLDWVVLHYSVNTGLPWQYNYPMSRNQNNVGVYEHNLGILLQQNDVMAYGFTYSSRATQCDTAPNVFSPGGQVPPGPASALAATMGPQQSNLPRIPGASVTSGPFGQPPSQDAQQQGSSGNSNNGVCPIITFETSMMPSSPVVGVTQYQLVFTGLTRSIPADWVDAHISFNTDMSRTPNMQWQQNYRMRRSDYNPYSFEKTGLTANPGDVIQAMYTYSASGKECNSQIFSYRV